MQAENWLSILTAANANLEEALIELRKLYEQPDLPIYFTSAVEHITAARDALALLIGSAEIEELFGEDDDDAPIDVGPFEMGPMTDDDTPQSFGERTGLHL